jgi:hypothetical protein
MIRRRTFLALLIYIAICTVLFNGRQPVEAAEHPAALILYPDATAIRFDKRGSIDLLSYHVSSKFPATPVIEWISDKLQKAGWEPLKYDFLNPELPSSHMTGWTYFLHGIKDPTVCVHQWLGDWKDASGNIVRYGFRYKQVGCGTLALTDLEVDGWYTPADAARQVQKLAKRMKDHPQDQ